MTTLEQKLKEEALIYSQENYANDWGTSIDPVSGCQHAYLAGTKSKTMLTHVIQRAVELAREGAVECEAFGEEYIAYDFEEKQITAKILEVVG